MYIKKVEGLYVFMTLKTQNDILKNNCKNFTDALP